METIELSILEKIKPAINQQEIGNTYPEKLRFSLVLGLFVSKAISLEEAAELAGYTLHNFVELLILHNIYWFDYTDEHLKLDEIAIAKYKQIAQ